VPEAAINVEHVRKAYRIPRPGRLEGGPLARLRARLFPPHETIWALDDVSLRIEPGEVVGAIGRNGSGKSTLLKVISKITRPTSGKVSTKGRVSSLLEVGTGFHPELSGRENVFLNGSILGMKRAEIRACFDEIVDFSGVGEFIDTPVKRYSSGMQLRLAFAVAAHLRGDVLLTDEVLAVGDAEFQRKCLQAMESLHDSGRTILFVSHNLGAIQSLCSRAIWLDRGNLVEDGPAEAVVRSYMASFQDAGQGQDLEERRVGGDGQVRFEEVRLSLRGKDEPLTSFVLGDEVDVYLRLRAEGLVADPVVNLPIVRSDGLNVAYVQNLMHGFPLESFQGEVELKVELPPLAFMPGEYQVNLWCGDRGSHAYDYVIGATSLSVIPGAGASDFMNKSWGVVYLPTTWSRL